MKEIILVGGGGHCRSVIDVIEQEGKYKIVGIVDKNELVGQEVFGYEILGSDEDLKDLREKYKNAFVTIGQIKSVEKRLKIFGILKELDYTLPVIISPLSYVSKRSKIEAGTIVMHHALVNAGASIGENCIINTKALIEHDAIIENHCHISTSAVINGGVHVKEGTFFGSNATSKECVDASGFVKAGSVVR